MRITKKDKNVIIITSLVVLVVVVAAGYLYTIKSVKETSSTPEKIEVKGSQDTQHAGWKTYTNEKYGFKVSYPQQVVDLNVPEIFDAVTMSASSSVYDSCTKEKINAQGVSFCPIRSLDHGVGMVSVNNSYVVRNGSSYYTVKLTGEYGSEGSCAGIPDCADYGTVKKIFEEQILPTFIFVR